MALMQVGAAQGPTLRFQLPNERNMYVDLLDDEDVQLMFDEWSDYAASPECVSNAKLQVRSCGSSQADSVARQHPVSISQPASGAAARLSNAPPRLESGTRDVQQRSLCM